MSQVEWKQSKASACELHTYLRKGCITQELATAACLNFFFPIGLFNKEWKWAQAGASEMSYNTRPWGKKVEKRNLHLEITKSRGKINWNPPPNGGWIGKQDAILLFSFTTIYGGNTCKPCCKISKHTHYSLPHSTPHHPTFGSYELKLTRIPSSWRIHRKKKARLHHYTISNAQDSLIKQAG